MRGCARYGGLAAAIALGLLLRFWNLDLKPLWLDETITLLFSLGRSYDDIPRETLLPLAELLQPLQWHPQSCSAIAETIAQQSTHPPLFFCLMHRWMGYLQESGHSLRWQVRSLSALFGTGAIAVMYILNRVAFSHRAGLWAAGLMAVSPFAVYLSQEARHYTLPMLVIAASLIPLVQLCAAAPAKRKRLPWLAWIGLNSLGFYVHYFCILAFAAQIVTLMAVFLQRRRAGGGTADVWCGAIATGSIISSMLPWLPVLLDHTQRPETDWLKFDATLGLHWLEPIARLLAGCIVTVIMLPVEEQPLSIAIVNGLLAFGFIGYLTRWLWQNREQLFQTEQACQSARVLQYFLLAVGVEYLLLVYILHKDLTLAFRYNFIFYPALCALLAASVAELRSQARNAFGKRLLPWALILVGVISSGFVATDAAFAKPFSPKQIAERLLHQPTNAHLVAIENYSNSQDVALGLSFALAVDQLQPATSEPLKHVEWGFSKSTDPRNDRLAIDGRSPLSNSFTLWRIGSLKADKRPMPEKLKLQVDLNSDRATATCLSQEKPFFNMGLTFQRYNCKGS
ncbi:glycosyltransferase family 39 protein [Altericista sp. CCNU0014]|uniref:glycosyltransferase family 39 protein n=1 Tax=Altericista sp. CCNU0014 TaxID=3082949 RepID=UPI00384EDF7C